MTTTIKFPTPESSTSTWLVPQLRQHRAPKQGAFSQEVLARIDVLSLSLLTGSSDVLLHTGCAAAKLTFAAVQVLLYPVVAGMTPQIYWLEAGQHAGRSLKSLGAAIAVPIPALVSPDIAIRAYEWLSLASAPKGLLASALSRVQLALVRAWSSPYRTPVLVGGAVTVSLAVGFVYISSLTPVASIKPSPVGRPATVPAEPTANITATESFVTASEIVNSVPVAKTTDVTWDNFEPCISSNSSLTDDSFSPALTPPPETDFWSNISTEKLVIGGVTAALTLLTMLGGICYTLRKYRRPTKDAPQKQHSPLRLHEGPHIADKRLQPPYALPNRPGPQTEKAAQGEGALSPLPQSPSARQTPEGRSSATPNGFDFSPVSRFSLSAARMDSLSDRPPFMSRISLTSHHRSSLRDSQTRLLFNSERGSRSRSRLELAELTGSLSASSLSTPHNTPVKEEPRRRYSVPSPAEIAAVEAGLEAPTTTVATPSERSTESKRSQVPGALAMVSPRPLKTPTRTPTRNPTTPRRASLPSPAEVQAIQNAPAVRTTPAHIKLQRLRERCLQIKARLNRQKASGSKAASPAEQVRVESAAAIAVSSSSSNLAPVPYTHPEGQKPEEKAYETPKALRKGPARNEGKREQRREPSPKIAANAVRPREGEASPLPTPAVQPSAQPNAILATPVLSNRPGAGDASPTDVFDESQPGKLSPQYVRKKFVTPPDLKNKAADKQKAKLKFDFKEKLTEEQFKRETPLRREARREERLARKAQGQAREASINAARPPGVFAPFSGKGHRMKDRK